MFCGRYLETLLFEGSIQMFRLSAAETARFPAGAAQYFDVVFTEVQSRISAYLAGAFSSPPALSDETAERLLGQVLYPRLPRALFGVDQLAKSLDDILSPEFDLGQIREAVADSIRGLQQHPPPL